MPSILQNETYGAILSGSPPASQPAPTSTASAPPLPPRNVAKGTRLIQPTPARGRGRGCSVNFLVALLQNTISSEAQHSLVLLLVSQGSSSFSYSWKNKGHVGFVLLDRSLASLYSAPLALRLVMSVVICRPCWFIALLVPPHHSSFAFILLISPSVCLQPIYVLDDLWFPGNECAHLGTCPS